MKKLQYFSISMELNSWKDLSDKCFDETGCRPYSGVGIGYRKKEKICICRSVDDTNYYDDDLNNIDNPEYTLFGQEGDQSLSEKRFNEPLLNRDKTKRIFLYRKVRKDKNTKKEKYIWYGEYEIISQSSKQHPDKNGNMRKIYILSLLKKS